MWIECRANASMLVNSDNVFTFDVCRYSGDCFTIKACRTETDDVYMGWYTKDMAELALLELLKALQRGDEVFEMPDQQELERKYSKLLGNEE